MMINQIEKTPLKSKKFLALMMMMLLTGGVLLAAVFMRAPADVINTAITVIGGTCGASCASFIGAQGFVDGKVRAAAIETEVVEVEVQRES